MSVPALSRGWVDRVAALRRDPGWLAARWSDSGSRAFAVQDGGALVDESAGRPRLVLSPPDLLPDGERLLLGVADGTAYFAVAAPLPEIRGAVPRTLREVGALLDDRDAGLLTHAVALANWHATHRHCGRCGAPTASVDGGAARRCPVDQSMHFPRVDPAVIMLVHDGDDRVLLGHGTGWAPGRYSILAGFVEPGESAEQAVIREVAEEVGLAVRDVTYAGSQPWPFPSSLMLGFTARTDHAPPRPDRDEIEDARWATRAEVRAGTVGLPPAVSIARWLLDAWLDEAPSGRATDRPAETASRRAGRPTDQPAETASRRADPRRDRPATDPLPG